MSTLKRQQKAAGDAQQRADRADQRALNDEDGKNARRRGTLGAQDGDVGLLVGDDHHLRGDDIEGRHSDDQGEDQEHHALFDRHRAKEIGMAQRPVARVGVGGQHRLELPRDPWRGEQVVELEPYAAHRVAEAVELLRVGQIDEREPAVELEHADLEHADDTKALDPRQRARRASPFPAAR